MQLYLFLTSALDEVGDGLGGHDTPRPLYPRDSAPVVIAEEGGWTPWLVHICIEKRKSLILTGVQTPDPPARSESPYRLRSPAPDNYVTVCDVRLFESKYSSRHFSSGTFNINTNLSVYTAFLLTETDQMTGNTKPQINLYNLRFLSSPHVCGFCPSLCISYACNRRVALGDHRWPRHLI